MQFMAISSQTGLNAGLDGILGLGPNREQGPSFVWSLQESGVIPKAEVSFNLGYNATDWFE
jgi:hypothetical protein